MAHEIKTAEENRLANVSEGCKLQKRYGAITTITDESFSLFVDHQVQVEEV